MKINYKNTALGLIDDPKNFNFGFPDPDITPLLSPEELRKFGFSLIGSSDGLKELCGSNIQYVSHSFLEAFLKGKSKLSAVFDKEDIDEGGVIIVGGATNGFTHWHTYYYYAKSYLSDDGEKKIQYLFIDFSKHSKSVIPNLDVYVSYSEGELKELVWNGYVEEGKDSTWWGAFVVSFILFKKYCETETKVIPANKKEHHIGVKYVNETKRKITVLDSTWFTTIVKSEGFGVSGHFRLQPCGPNNSERKLIYIAPFEKQGYTRTAKVLNQQ